MKLTRSEPIFAVSDVEATVRYWLDVLGFERHWFWNDPGRDGPATFGGVGWGDVHIMFSLMPQVAKGIEGHEHWLSVEDVNGMYESHLERGADIVSEIANKPWGVREYVVREVNGYRLRFAGATEYAPPPDATSELPHGIRVEVKPPELEDYIRITKSVGWAPNEETMPGALAGSVFCCTATDLSTERMVGMLRVCGDGRQYTIWDVMVEPTYQGKRIGSALMERALEELRRVASKGAYIGLFTGKGSFYERFGFRDGGGMSLTI